MRSKQRHKKYNLSSLNFIQIFLLFFLTGSISAQSICEEKEEEFKVFFNSEIQSLEEAQNKFDDYIDEKCKNLVAAYNFLGYANYTFSNLEEAKKNLHLGEEEYFKNKTKPFDYALNQMYTGQIFIIQKEYDRALEVFKIAEKNIEGTEEVTLKSSIYQNIAIVKFQLDELTEAEKYFNKSIEAGGLDSFSLAHIYQNLASLYLKQENSEKTSQYINLTKKLWKDLDNKKGLYLLSFIESKLEIAKENYPKALELLQNGRASFNNKEKLLLGENYILEAKLHRLMGNLESEKSALEYGLLNSVDLNESEMTSAIIDLAQLQNKEESVVLLTEIISKLKNQVKNQQDIYTSNAKQKDTEIAESKGVIKRQLLYIGLLAIGLLGILSFFIWNRIQRAKILKLNKDLELSNRKIEEQIQDLESKNSELENFAYVASHDLKSPLNTVSSFSDLIKKNLDNKDKVNLYFGYIDKAVSEMSSLIQDLLYHSTVNESFQPVTSNLDEIINDAILLLSQKIEESNTTIHFKKGNNAKIYCEKNQIKVVIQNLISNSINYSKEDTNTIIDIDIVEDQKNVKIKIKDNGIGISEEHLETIFEMFKRLKVNKSPGTGIGLATCKKIINRHNGDIYVESTVGEGSTFTICLPKDL